MVTHRNAFRGFLERAQDDGWIDSFEWYESDSFVLLREEMRSKQTDKSSKSHKKSSNGTFWGISVEPTYGATVGVDLELHIARPILDKPYWLCDRLGISRKTEPNKILEEWACREAAFKCLAPDNKGVYMSQFRGSSEEGLKIFRNGGDIKIRTRAFWWEKWVLALAWRLSE